jgi:D-sedoheptulose 7-phosphate isomerase
MQFRAWADRLSEALNRTEVTDSRSGTVPLEDAIARAIRLTRSAHDAGCKLMFIGNGGSAGICSHMAIDFLKNGGMRSTAFSDAAALTCLSNDLGFEQVYAKQVEMHARQGDVLIAISSSGRSQNILNAVSAAKSAGASVISLSGFSFENPLRRLGDLNFFVPSAEYGFVELAHSALLHSILDLAMGWSVDSDKIPGRQEMAVDS